MSVSGSLPITRARRLRPSDSFTVMRSARSMTWWFVRMLPSASMMKPVPLAAARRIAIVSLGLREVKRRVEQLRGSARPVPRGRRSVRAPLLVASMFTTAGLMRSTTSAKLTTWRTARRKRRSARAAAGILVAAGPATTADRVTPPAKMVPTRNATAAVRARRRESWNAATSSSSIIRARKRSSSSVSTPSFLAFSSLLPGVARRPRHSWSSC